MFRPGQAKGSHVGFNAGSAESIIPGADNTFDLGSASVGWRNIYADTGLYATYLTPGRVVFVGTGGVLTQDSLFNWSTGSRKLTIDTLDIEGSTATGGYDRCNGQSANGFIFQGAALFFNPGGATRGRWLANNGLILSNNASLASSSASAAIDSVNSFAMGIERVNVNKTLDITNGNIIVDATSGNITITLPASNSSARRIYNIKKIDSSANTVTITRSGSDTIDGATTVVLTTQYQSVTVQAEGANNAWWKI